MADGAWGGGGGVVSARWFDSAPNYYHCDWGVKGQTVYFNVKLISAVLGERMRNCAALWILRRSQRKSFHSSSFFLLIESAHISRVWSKDIHPHCWAHTDLSRFSIRETNHWEIRKMFLNENGRMKTIIYLFRFIPKWLLATFLFRLLYAINTHWFSVCFHTETSTLILKI